MSNAFVLTFACPDQTRIVHRITELIADLDGNIDESAQFGDVSTGRFSMRVSFSTSTVQSVASVREQFVDVADQLQMDWTMHDAAEPARVLLLVSKFDHCLVDLLYRMKKGELPITIPAVVSNHNDVQGIVASHDIPFLHYPVTRETKNQQETRIVETVEEYDIDFVVLARYMQILSSDLCKQLSGRVINIHHSFLPGFKGAKPYHQAHERGVKIIGATAHYATADLDEGPIIEQDVARVTHSHSPKQLVAMGREIEQRVLARAVKYQAEHRVILNGHKTVVFS